MVYCSIYDQWIYDKVFRNWFCQYLSFLDALFYPSKNVELLHIADIVIR